MPAAHTRAGSRAWREAAGQAAGAPCRDRRAGACGARRLGVRARGPARACACAEGVRLRAGVRVRARAAGAKRAMHTHETNQRVLHRKRGSPRRSSRRSRQGPRARCSKTSRQARLPAKAMAAGLGAASMARRGQSLNKNW